MASLIILGLDGTLYNFDGDSSLGFTASGFYKEIRNRVYQLFHLNLAERQEINKMANKTRKRTKSVGGYSRMKISDSCIWQRVHN